MLDRTSRFGESMFSVSAVLFAWATISNDAVRRRSLYIAAATIFWSFNILEDAKRPIDDTAFVPGIVSHQKPFSLAFEPRTDAAHLRELMGSQFGEGGRGGD